MNRKTILAISKWGGVFGEFLNAFIVLLLWIWCFVFPIQGVLDLFKSVVLLSGWHGCW
jgi:hypothetical protein